MHRLTYKDDRAAGQLAVFQGASEVSISESYGSSEQQLVRTHQHTGAALHWALLARTGVAAGRPFLASGKV